MTRSALQKMTKDSLVKMVIELQEEIEKLKDENKLAEEIDSLKSDIEILEDENKSIAEDLQEVERDLQEYEEKYPIDFAYNLRNAIDDVLNNVTRETLGKVKYELQACYDRLDLITSNSSIKVLPLVI